MHLAGNFDTEDEPGDYHVTFHKIEFEGHRIGRQGVRDRKKISDRAMGTHFYLGSI